VKLYALAGIAMLALLPVRMHAQGGQFVGSITAISGTNLTVKPDKGGDPQQFAVPDSTVLKRIEPGQTSLSSAVDMKFSDLAVGDRVLVRLDSSASSPTASRIVAIKGADLAQKQKADQEDWQRRGVAGLVKSVDPAAGVIMVTTGAGPMTRTVTVKTASSTKLLRYSPQSIKFADAAPGPIDSVKPGDQLRARGTKSADGSEVAADEVVSGTFRNIAGTISEVDASGSTLLVKDLATKKPVTIHIAPDVQMRRIPDQMARMLAARLKGNGPGATFNAGGGGNYGGGAGQGSSAGSGQGAPGGRQPGAPSGGFGAGGSSAGGNSPFRGGMGGAGGGDPQRFLSMAPAIKLGDLQKGEAVMVVTTAGSSDVNAITLLAGVEPLLEAPAATDLLANWSMGGGGAEAAAGTP